MLKKTEKTRSDRVIITGNNHCFIGKP